LLSGEVNSVGNYGDDYIIISDEDGNEYELEHLDSIEFEGKLYRAFLPVSENEDEVYEMILFRIVEEDGEEILERIDDENEAERVYQKFMEQLFSEDEDSD
jgi:uncharacterized protein YrzB (UPF0473 family)